MNHKYLCFLSIAEVSRLISAREVSPVALVQATLNRIEKLDAKLGAYITVAGESALDSARQAEREIAGGRYRGPLHGIPVSLKDIIYAKGVRNTGGSRLMADFVPDYDATVTERLRAAGAILVGKTQLYELAMGPKTYFEPGYTRNPWDLNRLPGGSSSGSAAAVAAGLCHASLGTDTGGSIRGPASICGVAGFKPSFGLVSRHGITLQSWSLDHAGPLARTVEDCALVMNAIAGHDPRDPSSGSSPAPDFVAGLEGGIRGLRIGLCPGFYPRGIDPEFQRALDRAVGVLESAGATLREVSLPHLRFAPALYSAIVLPEAASLLEEWIRSRASLFGPDARTKTELGCFVPATDYLKAQRVRALFQREYASAMKEVDLLATATFAGPPPSFDEVPPRSSSGRAALVEADRARRSFNLLGAPALSLPCGFTSTGLPIGMQLAGRPMEDALVLRAAHTYQQLTDWHRRHPPAD